MKTKLYFPIISLLAISTLVFFSCDDSDADTTKPVIELHEPEEGEVLKTGGEEDVEMHFDVDLSDDVMLGSYKIEIHPNFDHHDHSKSRATGDAETVDFTFNRAYDVSDLRNTHIHHHDVVIPKNATPGDYHLMVYCTDAAKNQTYITRNISLSTTAEEDHDHDHDE